MRQNIPNFDIEKVEAQLEQDQIDKISTGVPRPI